MKKNSRPIACDTDLLSVTLSVGGVSHDLAHTVRAFLPKNQIIAISFQGIIEVDRI